jgi:hypothetical protein
MTRTNGRIIGPYQSFGAAGASGVHDSFDQYNYKLTGQWPYPMSVSVSLSTTSLNETTNKDLVVTLNTTGYASGTQFSVEAVNVSNFSSSDMNPYSGTVTVTGDEASATGSTTLTVVEDYTDETPDTETFKVEVRGALPATTLVATSSNVTISDTSTAAPALSVSFYESAYGADIGTINVLVCKLDSTGNNVVSSTNVYTKTGPNSPATSNWSLRSGSNYPSLSSGDKYSVCWHHNKTASGFQGDYAIDVVTITGTTYSFDSSSQSFVSTYGTNYTSVEQAFLNTGATLTSTSAVLGRWNRDIGTTPSGNTGPTSDVSGSGYFLYTETSGSNSSAVNFWLFSPVFTVP